MNLWKRIIVSAIFIPLLIWLYYTGGIFLKGFLGLLTILSSYEIIKMYEKKNVKLMFFNAVASFLFFYCILWSSTHAVFILFFIILLNGLRDIFVSNIDGALQRISGSVFAVVYPAVGFGLLYKLGDFHHTLVLVLAALIWVTDSFAYFTGMLFGKHKGIFKCSPNKSCEGFIGGLMFALIGAWLTRYIDSDFYTTKVMIMLGISAGFFGQIGDLFESLIKRDMGVKDSSNLIPGHGGVLDRFDSILIAAPVLYLFFAT